MKKTILLFTLLAFSLFSCNDVSDFLFETEQVVEIRTIENGSIFSGGESFPLDILSERAVVPEEYKITIIDEFGVNWGETTVIIEDAEEEYNSSLIVPSDLPPGKYVFHIQVFENEQEIVSREIILFKTDVEYIIDELISLPQETEVGKDVFIQAQVSSPELVDPYLRWSLNGVVLNEGFVSEELDTLYWIAEDKAGLYSVLLEVFPEEVSSDMVSSVRDTVEIIVTVEDLVESGSLQPEEDYSLLYHFDGDLSPESPEQFVNSIIGEAGAVPYNNTFFYTLSGNNGISAKGEILPVENGLLTPFSINGRLSLFSPVQSGSLFRAFDGDEQFLSISSDDKGFLALDLGAYTSRSRAPVTEMTDFTIHVIPGIITTEIRWFFNGIPGGVDYFETGLLVLAEEQRVILGGDDLTSGASIVLDEFGIFTGSENASSVDSEHFRRIKKELLGPDLVDARGFDDIEAGKVFIPGERTLISAFTGSVKDMEGILAFSEPDESLLWDLLLLDEEGREIYRISQNSLVTESDPKTGLEMAKIRFSLRDEGSSKQIVINNDDSASVFLESFLPGERYSLFLETHVENKSNVILDYYIIYTKTDSLIPETVATVEEEENLL